ncbi:hypothetical protein D3C87_1831510 [compost metagenome]
MIEAVNSLRQGMANTGNGTDQVGTWAQVRHFAQVFDAVAFGRHRVRVRIVNPTDHFNLGRLQFETLTFAWRGDHFAGHFNRAAGGQMQHFILIIRQRIINDGL